MIGDRIGPNQHLAPDVWRKILEGLAEIDDAHNLILNYYNEPLADRAILDRIREARARAPKARIMIYSNGDDLDRAFIDDLAGRTLRESGEFARPEVDLITELCSRRFIDIGANIGAIALPVARRRPNATVIAVEAHRALAGCLAANALNNQLHNVEAIHAAVGSEAGLVDFPTPPLAEVINHGTTRFEYKDARTEPVRMTTLDQPAVDGADIVKIDVEGFEPQVLAGGRKTLNDVRPHWLIEVSPERPDASRQVVETMAGAGYNLFWFCSLFTTPQREKPK